MSCSALKISFTPWTSHWLSAWTVWSSKHFWARLDFQSWSSASSDFTFWSMDFSSDALVWRSSWWVCNLEILCLWSTSWLATRFLFSWAAWRLEMVLSRFYTNRPKRALPPLFRTEEWVVKNQATCWNWSIKVASRSTRPTGFCKSSFNWLTAVWSWSLEGSKEIEVKEVLVGVWHFWKVKETSSRSLSMSPRLFGICGAYNRKIKLVVKTPEEQKLKRKAH